MTRRSRGATRERALGTDVRLGGRWGRGQRLKNDLIYAVAWGALAVAVRLPAWFLRGLCRAVGVLAYGLLGRERRRVRARLGAGLGAALPEARVRGVFRRAGESLADTVALLRPGERAGRTLALAPGSAKVFASALGGGRGVVFVSAHLGPWERMAALLVEEGFPVATVARESYDPRFTRLYERLRAPRGVRSLYRGAPGAGLAIARELRRGGAVGFLLDVPARVSSAPAVLFGEKTLVPVGAARLALRLGAAVVVGTCAPGGLVRITPVETGDLGLGAGAGAEQCLVDRMVAELEARIAAEPEAWLGLFAPPAPVGAGPADVGPGPLAAPVHEPG